MTYLELLRHLQKFPEDRLAKTEFDLAEVFDFVTQDGHLMHLTDGFIDKRSGKPVLVLTENGRLPSRKNGA